MTKVITIQDRVEWVSYIRKAAEFDCYHTWHYNSLNRIGKPILFIYEEQDNFIAIPLIARPVEGTEYYDLTSVYGFSGPISNKKIDELDDRLTEDFKSAFTAFLSSENYISVFSRLNPFFKQVQLLKKFGGIYDNGRTVVLDLSLSIEEQRKSYSESVRGSIRKAWRNGYRVKEEKGPRAIALFTSIYTENMHRVDASDYYLFNKEYFQQLLDSDEYDTRILMVYDGSEVMASTMIILTNGIIQAYLVGTRKEYIKYSPTKFLVDEITLLGRTLGMRYFNLGGGLGFKEDSLLNWKLAFTDNTFDYKSWRYIANPTVYQQLIDEKGIDKDAEIDFFPLYRYA
jgi:hypothetical protein